MVVKNKSVLVTGGTGTIGKKVVEFLLAKNYQVFVLSRQKIKNTSQISYINGDINDILNIKSLDYIIHLAACLNQSDQLNCQKVNVDGTNNILRLAQKLNVKKIVFASTILVFQDSLNIIRDENWNKDLNSSNYYVRTKLQAEENVTKSSTNSVVVYPTAVLDLNNRGEPAGSFLAKLIWKLCGSFNGCLNCLFGDGHRILNYVLVDDIATGIILALEKGRNKSGYILGGINIEVSKYLKVMAKYYHTHTLPFRLPDIFSQNKNLFFSSQKAITELGYNPKMIS